MEQRERAHGTRPQVASSLTADARTLKALAHPVRLALLDVLLDRSLSATEAAEAIGESPTTCSFHLRQLAKYGLVEVDDLGPGRRRTWRRSVHNWRIPSSTLRDEVTSPAYEVILDRYLSQTRTAMVELLQERNPRWAEASTSSQSIFYLTAPELAQLSNHVQELLQAYASRVGSRSADPRQRPRDSRRVEVVVFAVPAPRARDGRE